jgi:YidC/Oxa1 family membrane protein insertase
MASFFNTFFFQPLYNGLIFLFDILPWADAGIIVILFTVLVKLFLFPLSFKSVKTQLQMKKFEPELKRIREDIKDKQEQALKIMAFYKEKGINPFASLFLILIQLPIIFALYYIFLKSGLPSVNESLLYPFIGKPEQVNMLFLGLIDIAKKSAVLAVLAAVSSYFQLKFSMPPLPKREENATFKDDLARTMNLQMRYVFPVIVLFISYNISGAVALYWLTSNIFTIAQELYVKKKLKLGVTPA